MDTHETSKDKVNWNWLKEKVAEALLNAMAWMALIVLGYSCIKAWRAESDSELQREKNQIEITKIKLENGEKMLALQQKLVEMNNETVLREAELLNKITSIETKINKPIQPPILPSLPEIRPLESSLSPNQAPLDYFKQYKK